MNAKGSMVTIKRMTMSLNTLINVSTTTRLSERETGRERETNHPIGKSSFVKLMNWF